MEQQPPVISLWVFPALGLMRGLQPSLRLSHHYLLKLGTFTGPWFPFCSYQQLPLVEPWLCDTTLCAVCLILGGLE